MPLLEGTVSGISNLFFLFPTAHLIPYEPDEPARIKAKYQYGLGINYYFSIHSIRLNRVVSMAHSIKKLTYQTKP